MAVSCDMFWKLLQRDAIDGKELDPEEYLELEEHAATCTDCRERIIARSLPVKPQA